MKTNVISLLERRAARHANNKEEPRKPTPQAISMALRYLKEDAQEIGDRGLARMLDLAAVEARTPFVGEGMLPHVREAQDPAQVLGGVAKCLGRLKEESREAGDGIMTDLIHHAYDATLRRVEHG
jgi:hypothetical protein